MGAAPAAAETGGPSNRKVRSGRRLANEGERSERDQEGHDHTIDERVFKGCAAMENWPPEQRTTHISGRVGKRGSASRNAMLPPRHRPGHSRTMQLVIDSYSDPSNP